MSKKINPPAQIIYDFYTILHNFKPDATYYKAYIKVITTLLESKDETVGVYTYEQIHSVIRWLESRDIRPDNITILFYPKLIRSVLDNNTYELERIENYLYKKEKKERADPPDGW